MRRPIIVLACALLVGACGYKGPLYFPKDKPAAKPAAKPSSERPAADKPQPETSGAQ